jgi:hypothetical protein
VLVESAGRRFAGNRSVEGAYVVGLSGLSRPQAIMRPAMSRWGECTALKYLAVN